MRGWARFWDYARKAGMAALTGIAVGLAYHIFPNPWDVVANAVLVVAGYFGAFGVKNVPVSGLPTPSGNVTREEKRGPLR